MIVTEVKTETAKLIITTNLENFIVTNFTARNNLFSLSPYADPGKEIKIGNVNKTQTIYLRDNLVPVEKYTVSLDFDGGCNFKNVTFITGWFKNCSFLEIIFLKNRKKFPTSNSNFFFLASSQIILY